MSGILHLGGTVSADLNILIQVALAAAMTGGVICARRRHYRAHGVVEVSVVLLNLAAIAFLMLPSFPRAIWKKAPAILARPYYAVVTIHALLGLLAESFGLYVVLSAGTILLPEGLRLRNYKLWMRTTFALWMLALVAGGAVYYVWYVYLPR